MKLTREEIDRLADQIAVDAATIESATYALLVKIRRFDEARGWAAQGAKSCAAWLSWRIGIGLAAAREKVRVARRLREFPRIAQAFRRGELSYSKVRACVREHMPADKDEVLLHQARGATGAQLERICAAYHTVASRNRPIDEVSRCVRRRTNRDGTITIEIRLMPDEAERVYQAIVETRRAMQSDGQDDSAESTDSAPTLADAAVALAEAQFAPTRSSSTISRPQLFIHLREERIAESSSWKAELHDGTVLSGDSLKRVACDAGLVIAKTDGCGDPLDIGRRRRTVSPSLFRALVMRDRRCQFPGCTQQAFLAAHQIRHWLDCGPTKKVNLTLVCHHHHVALHEGGFTAARNPDGALVVFDPAGNKLEAHRPRLKGHPVTTLRRRAAAQGIHIDERTSLVCHNGMGLDLHAAVAALCFRREAPSAP